jgi:multidrug efflux system membrane fusion protein
VVAAGQAVFTLANDGEREIAISLPERDIGSFRLGQPVLVELWSNRGERVPGSIRELSASADPLTRTYAARVSFDASVTDAQLGQSARVYAATQGEATLSVPLSAISADAQQAQVWRVDPETMTVHRSIIEHGEFGEQRVPIISGLSAQDWIVVSGVHLLREGQKVRPVDRDNRGLTLTAAN